MDWMWLDKVIREGETRPAQTLHSKKWPQVGFLVDRYQYTFNSADLVPNKIRYLAPTSSLPPPPPMIASNLLSNFLLMILVHLTSWPGVPFVFSRLVIISGDDNSNAWFLFKTYMSKPEHARVLPHGTILTYWSRARAGIPKGSFDLYLAKISKYFKAIQSNSSGIHTSKVVSCVLQWK